jgi:hypothetical protein
LRVLARHPRSIWAYITVLTLRRPRSCSAWRSAKAVLITPASGGRTGDGCGGVWGGVGWVSGGRRRGAFRKKCRLCWAVKGCCWGGPPDGVWARSEKSPLGAVGDPSLVISRPFLGPKAQSAREAASPACFVFSGTPLVLYMQVPASESAAAAASNGQGPKDRRTGLNEKSADQRD